MSRNLYSSPGGGVDLDLGGQVGAGVPLLPHGQRRQLRVAQVQLGVGVVDAAAEMLLILPVGEDLLAALAHHDGGPGVLAHGQHPAGRDARVLQQVRGHETVVAAGLRIIQDGPQLAQVRGPQQVGDVPHALAGTRVSTSGSTSRKSRPNEPWFLTPSLVSSRYLVASGPGGAGRCTRTRARALPLASGRPSRRRCRPARLRALWTHRLPSSLLRRSSVQAVPRPLARGRIPEPPRVHSPA